MSNLVRLSLFGKEIESISVVGVESRRKIKEVSEKVFLGANSKLLVGNEESNKGTNITLVSNIVDGEEKVDLGIRNILGVANYGHSRELSVTNI